MRLGDWSRTASLGFMAESGPKIDPALTRALSTASSSGQRVQAVFKLRPPSSAAGKPSAAETQALVERVMSRVRSRAGIREKDYNVFPFLRSFVVDAEPHFIEELLTEPEVAAAVVNRQPSSAKASAPCDDDNTD